MNSWIATHPQWFLSEYRSVVRAYPSFQVCESGLRRGNLAFVGELVIRPQGGSIKQPILLMFPDATPYVFPTVFPLERLPEFDEKGYFKKEPETKYFDRLHQMAGGALCLFQHQSRDVVGGEAIRAVDVLKRAEKWFLGHYTGHWPPDSHLSELESHFDRAGDILIGQHFQSPSLPASGQFFAIRDVNQLLTASAHDLPPLLAISAIANTGFIATVEDARADLIPIFPWLENDFWKPDKIAQLDQARQRSDAWNFTINKGFWWNVNVEPAPFRDGAGLLRELQSVAPGGNAWEMVSQAIGADLTTEATHIFGLRFPGRQDQPSWLVIEVTMPSAQTTSGAVLFSRGDQAKRSRFEKGTVKCYRSHTVRQADLQLRNQSVVAPSVQEKCVALIGLGALGSKVAELLAQAGVGRFRLCDVDRLSIGNVARHVGGINDFGAPKTHVVKTRILRINSYSKIEKEETSPIVFLPAQLGRFCEGVDLVISTMADENAEASLNLNATSLGIPCLYGRSMRRGSMGRIFLVRPKIDACKACLAEYANSTSEEASHKWIQVTESVDDILLQECGRPVIPASAVDLSFVASLIARKALDVIEGKSTANNHLVWSRGGDPDVDSRLAAPFSVVEIAYPPLSACTSCQAIPIESVEISKELQEVIVQAVESSPAVETGGVLLGYIENGKAIVTRVTGPGLNSVRTPTRFERDVDYVQAQVESGINELAEKGLYIGEWHSHLEKNPIPSGQDVVSMVGIAKAPNYATDCPVMVIAGIHTKTSKFSQLKCWAFPTSGSARQLSVTGPVKSTLEIN